MRVRCDIVGRWSRVERVAGSPRLHFWEIDMKLEGGRIWMFPHSPHPELSGLQGELNGRIKTARKTQHRSVLWRQSSKLSERCVLCVCGVPEARSVAGCKSSDDSSCGEERWLWLWLHLLNSEAVAGAVVSHKSPHPTVPPSVPAAVSNAMCLRRDAL